MQNQFLDTRNIILSKDSAQNFQRKILNDIRNYITFNIIVHLFYCSYNI